METYEEIIEELKQLADDMNLCIAIPSDEINKLFFDPDKSILQMKNILGSDCLINTTDFKI